MLTRIEIQNVKGNILPLPLQNTSGGYAIRSIDGLDPVKATLVSSQMAQVDGAQPQSSRRETRNIIMKIGFMPDYIQHSVASLRSNLYNYLMPKALVTLYFYVDDVLFATTSATVESFQNSLFSADPEVDISFICYDPDFYAPDPVTVSGNTVSDTTSQIITYNGTSPAGIIFTLSANRNIAGFQMYNTKPDGTVLKFDFVGTILNGDVVTVTSIPMKKSAVNFSSSINNSVLYGVQPASDWIEFENGVNDFRVYVSGATIPYTLTYTPKYGGF